MLTQRSISSQTEHTIHQLKTESARIRVYDEMQSHQRRKRYDDLSRQFWEDHGNLQDEVRKLRPRKNGYADGEEEEDNANPLYRERRWIKGLNQKRAFSSNAFL